MKYDIEELFRRFPDLTDQREIILESVKLCQHSLEAGGTLFTCGNGGSAADAEHIVGELLKGFRYRRGVDNKLKNELENSFGNEGRQIGNTLQYGLRAISLNSHLSFSSAYANDVCWDMVFAQQLFALGKKMDVLIGLTTSGNSVNVVKSLQLARVMGIKTIVMTGSRGGKCAELANCVIKSPSDETYVIQEYHQPIYHAICALLEEFFYGDSEFNG